MTFPRRSLFQLLAAIGFGCLFFAGLSFAQQTVSISLKYTIDDSSVPAAINAPVYETYMEAVPSNAGSVTSVVFYRNDVPIFTDTTSPYRADQGKLGQDSYSFRARANYSNGDYADSADTKLTTSSPAVYKMGTTILGVPTDGPKRWGNHTQQIQDALTVISNSGGGTLFFPCTYGPRYAGGNPTLDGYSIYVIKDTIKVPPNVTLQGEAAGDKGRCQIWWHDPGFNPNSCTSAQASGMNKPMFMVVGKSHRVRFRDLAFRAMAGGEICYYGRDAAWIANDGTTAIKITTKGKVELDPSSDGDVSDLILENVAITMFTHGISAFSHDLYKVHNVKIRGALPVWNHRQLYIDAPLAYDWDVQNFDAAALGAGQGALEIIKSGTPAGYNEGRGDLRFVQLNCAGGPRRALPGQPATTPSTCITVNKHGGLYFKQVHIEGPYTSIIVNDIAETNTAPIVFEASVLAGEFYDEDMKLYTIGSFLNGVPESPQPSFWDSKMHFYGKGLQSKVVDCGNIHGDRTDTDGNPNDLPEWGDWTMSYTHSERQRPSYFDMTNGYAFRKEPIPCPVGRSDGIPDTSEMGGAYFDSGVLPTEAAVPYTNALTCNLSLCDLTGLLTPIFNSTTDAGAVRITGNWELFDEIIVPPGRLIVGSAGSLITLKTANKSIFKRPLGVQWEVQNGQNVLVPIPAASIVLRDLNLKSTTQVGTTGVSFIGTGPCSLIPNPNTPDPNDTMPDMSDLDCHLGASTDFYFSNLTIEGFDVGFYGGRYDINSPEPQLDSIGLKNMKFVNNKTAGVSIAASNASNWNMIGLEMQSNVANAEGWLQKFGGHQSFQTVKCSGVGAAMASCLRLETTGSAILGIRAATNVTNLVTIDSPYGFFGRMTGNMLIRDSDFRSSVANTSRFNILGKIFMVSMNNRYQYFNVGTNHEGNKTRVNYCGDGFAGDPFPDLDDFDDNLYFGINMPTRVSCKSNSKPWSEPFKWGGVFDPNTDFNDTPLAGNFYDDVRDDYVIYRRSAQSLFMIRKGSDPVVGEPPTKTISWGLPTDSPVVGRFLTSTPRSQVVAWRTGTWYVTDPNTSNVYYFYWGMTGDIPFAGNFFQEAGGPSAQRDEIAVFRPGTNEIWIQDPRNSGTTKYINLNGYRGNQVQVGDFTGVGNDQIAMFNAGAWYIVDPHPAVPALVATPSFGAAGDTAVVGKYLGQALGYPECTQLGIWNPTNEEFVVRDTSSACGGRGISPAKSLSIGWGSNGNYGANPVVDDIPLTVTVPTANGVRDRPTAYRQSAGYFQYSNQNGLWFVHDPF